MNHAVRLFADPGAGEAGPTVTSVPLWSVQTPPFAVWARQFNWPNGL